MRIKLENRKISCLKNEIMSTDLYIIIENINQSHHYECLFNSEVLVGDFSNNTLVYNLDKILDINIISLKVLDVNNKFLYTTNALELIRVEPKIKVDMTEVEVLKSRFNKFLDRYYKEYEKLMVGAYAPKTIVEKVDYDDTHLLSKIKTTSDNVDKSLLEMREMMSQIPNPTQVVNEKLADIKRQIEDELTSFENKISNQSEFINLAKKEIYQSFDTFKKDLTDKNSHNVTISQKEIQRVEKLVGNYNSTFEQKSKEIVSISENLKSAVDKSIKEMKQELVNHDYTIDIHALERAQNEHKSQLLDMKNVKISAKTTLEPNIFVMKYGGEFYPYKFSKNFPIGVSDENGNIVVHGRAIVKYSGIVAVGDYVYGNNIGIAEQYDIGYIVLNILEDNLCEIFFK